MRLEHGFFCEFRDVSLRWCQIGLLHSHRKGLTFAPWTAKHSHCSNKRKAARKVNARFLYLLFDPVVTPIASSALVFFLALTGNTGTRLPFRLGSAALFAIGAYVAVFGGMASYLLRDASLPLQGWHALLSLGRGFLPPLAAALCCWLLGFMVRRFGKSASSPEPGEEKPCKPEG